MCTSSKGSLHRGRTSAVKGVFCNALTRKDVARDSPFGVLQFVPFVLLVVLDFPFVRTSVWCNAMTDVVMGRNPTNERNKRRAYLICIASTSPQTLRAIESTPERVAVLGDLLDSGFTPSVLVVNR